MRSGFMRSKFAVCVDHNQWKCPQAPIKPNQTGREREKENKESKIELKLNGDYNERVQAQFQMELKSAITMNCKLIC